MGPRTDGGAGAAAGGRPSGRKQNAASGQWAWAAGPGAGSWPSLPGVLWVEFHLLVATRKTKEREDFRATARRAGRREEVSRDTPRGSPGGLGPPEAAEGAAGGGRPGRPEGCGAAVALTLPRNHLPRVRSLFLPVTRPGIWASATSVPHVWSAAGSQILTATPGVANPDASGPSRRHDRVGGQGREARGALRQAGGSARSNSPSAPTGRRTRKPEAPASALLFFSSTKI